jgi:hypothetical protein
VIRLRDVVNRMIDCLQREVSPGMLANKKFGEPDEAPRRAPEEISDLDRLDRLSDRVPDGSTREELLQPL